MSDSRRDFLKFVIAGSVAAGCPFDLSALTRADASRSQHAAPQIDGDHFEICHQIRDNHAFARPPVSKRHDVVIVGGGVSGMSAAYFLQRRDFLLLEKEPHCGGNATEETYNSQAFATGSAFDTKDSASDHLARELGLSPLPINSPDPTIVRHKWVADTWRDGLDQLPYPASVREAFKKFRKEMLALDPDKDATHLDSLPLSHFLKNYPPQIAEWWDAYGPSNWAANAADTSSLAAVTDLHEMAGDEPDVRVTLPGGNGALAQRLAETLRAKFADQILNGTTIVAVEPQRSDVHVTYVHAGQLHTVAANFVIMATPKFITARLISGLPEAQAKAMSAIRYRPYAVINAVFDRPVYRKAYDTWCPGNSFTDFVVAEWVSLSQPGDQPKNNIVTFYTPIAEGNRAQLLTEEGCLALATNVLRDFRKLLPEFDVAPVEVHLCRRGHPMFVTSAGTFTRLIPAASRPFGRIYFANTDSVGPVSDIGAAVESGRRAADQIEKRMTALPSTHRVSPAS
jgi:monoamine oxidase